MRSHKTRTPTHPRTSQSGAIETMEPRRLLSAAASTNIVQLLPASSPAVGTGFDTTATNVVDLQIAYSLAAAANTTICQFFSLESLN